MDLTIFNQLNFPDALKAFFNELKVPVNYVADEPTTAQEILPETYKNNETFGLTDEVYFVGMVDDAAFEGNDSLPVEKIKSDYDGILLFGVTLKERPNGLLPTRSQLAEIARAFNREFYYTPVVVVFKYGNCLAFANAEREKYRIKREGEKAGKVSLLRNIDYSVNEQGNTNTHQGHKRILQALSVDAIKAYDRRNKVDSFASLYKGWQLVFSTSILNEQFYKDYQQLSVKIIRAIHPVQIQDKLKAHQGALNLLNRLMFVYFIQKKRWLMNDPEFLFHFWQDYQTANPKEDTFHAKWLNTIFFNAFNGKVFDAGIYKTLPEKYHKAIPEFPYLNGGLFTKTEEDEFLLTDELFAEIFIFLQGYIFTISEDTADEINLEINPELLGKMYEGMINATDLNDVDAENGIVYTERPEINFMTRRSFVEVLNKKLPAKYSREFLYHFCFDKPAAKAELLKRFKVNAGELKEAILSITALDPSCGSGSMLIGVIQLQVELVKCLDAYSAKPHTPKDDFYLKKQIISESIYGVDIKEWAVRIAELRFWLYMIAEAEFTTRELTKEPLLPNLDFKLRRGNSLLQEIGNVEFSVKGLFKGRKKNAGATRKLNEFIKKKKAFITNQAEQATSYKKLKQEELTVFKEFINEIIAANLNEIRSLSKTGPQQDIFGAEKKGHLFEDTIAGRERENEQLHKVLASIKATGQLPFSYDIDFMEVFLAKEDDPGFDLIIGNPPYVKNEEILPAEDAVELERLLLPKNKKEKVEVNKAYKEKLSTKVYDTYPFLRAKVKTQIDGKTKNIDVYGSKVPGRSDLYVYFQLLAPALLNSKGTFCFIISNSWLDVEYGGYVQHFLLKHTQLHAIYDSNVRSFSAKVNTIIYLHSSVTNTTLSENQYKTLKPDGKPIKFVLNKTNYTDTAYAPLLIEQEHCSQNTFRPYYRIIAKTPNELWEDGYSEENYSYQNSKWGGKHLRAPEIYFKLIESGRLKPLKDMATISPGCYAGISDFFYVNQPIIERFEIESHYLVPLLRNSSCINQLKFEETGWFVISCNETKSNIQRGLKSYIEWGEKQVTRQRQKTSAGIPYPETESVKNRKPGWWAIPDHNLTTTDLFMQYVGSARFYSPVSKVPMASDRSFHRIFYGNESLKLSLNSSITWLFVLLMGRSNLGEGALKFEKSDALNLLTCDLSSKKIRDLNSYRIFSREPFEILIELGFDKTLSIREQEPNPLPDRKELDDIIFDEIGLTLEERKEVYWATAELVQNRLDKAASR